MIKKITRKIKVGTNVFVSVVLALGCWVLVGWINQRHYHRFDVTANRAYSLSDKTGAILRGLDKPLTITTLLRPGSILERNVKDMLEEYASQSKQITVTHIDPDRDAAKVELLAKRLKLDSFQLNSVIFETTGKSKQVTSGEMEEAEPGANPFMPQQTPPKFKGEEAFTSTILNLTQGKVPTVFFTSGHGEKDQGGTDRTGISELVKFLKRENINLENIDTLAKGDIPVEADAVVIASPRQKFLPAEVEKIDAYLKRGGKLLVLLDPLVETGLDTMLLSWGVQVGNDVVLDPVRRLFFAGPTTLVVGDFGAHPIVRKLQGSAVLFSLARSVAPAKNAIGDVQVLLKTSKEAWGESDIQDKQAKFDQGKDLQGPVSLGVAVERPAAGEKTKNQSAGETRLVVFGDGDFLTNLQLGNASNLDLFTSAINWLTHREKLISIGPKANDTRQVTATAGQMQAIFWISALCMPLGGVIAGSAVRYRRRR